MAIFIKWTNIQTLEYVETVRSYWTRYWAFSVTRFDFNGA